MMGVKTACENSNMAARPGAAQASIVASDVRAPHRLAQRRTQFLGNKFAHVPLGADIARVLLVCATCEG